uniref:Integrase catalytic domain-containing protein n=1 Tax=Strongyloides papillosus TaxID=174720 RepID=A0A0N5BSH4_STREA
REFGESVDGYVSRLNDLRRAAGLSEDFLVAKIICNIQKEYRTMLKNLTDVDLSTIKSLLKDIDEEKSLVADLNRFFRSGLQSNAPPPTKTTSPDHQSTPINREIFNRPRKSTTQTTQLLPKSSDTIHTPKPSLLSSCEHKPFFHQHNISLSSTESIQRIKPDAYPFNNLNEKSKKSNDTENVEKLLMVSEWKDLLNTNYDDLLTVDTLILPSNELLTFTLDCGARYNYISSDILNTLNIELPTPNPTDMFVVGFNGLPVKTESIINLNLTINDKSTTESFYVLPKSNYAILGWESIETIITAPIPKSTYISRDILPDVIDHVEEQVSKGYLSEVSAPEIYSSVTIVKKPDGGIRISERLQFGLNVATEIFNYALEFIINGPCDRSHDSVSPLIYSTIPIPKDMSWKIEDVYHFVDDIIVVGDDSTHVSRVIELLRRLDFFQMEINLTKSKFCHSKMEFIGYEIQKNSVRLSEERLSKAMTIKKPSSPLKLKNILGQLEIAREFIPAYSELMILFKNEKSKHWTPVHDEAFDRIKGLLLQHHILTPLTDQKYLNIDINNSKEAIWAVLSISKDGQDFKVTRVYSRYLSSSEINYSDDEKSILTAIECISRFEYLVHNLHTTIRIPGDQNLFNLYWLKPPTNPIARTRQAKYKLILIPIEKQNIDASTHESPQTSTLMLVCKEDDVNELISLLHIDIDDLKKEVSSDMIAKLIIDKDFDQLKKLRYTHLVKLRKLIKYESGILTINDRLFIPKSLHDSLLYFLHHYEGSHIGLTKMKRHYRKDFYAIGFDKRIQNFECTNCIKHASHKRKELSHWEKSMSPMERVHADYGNIDNFNLLIITDSFSNFIYCQTTPTLSANDLISGVRKFIHLYGTPLVFVSDHGTNFKSSLFESFMVESGILHLLTPVNHPESNSYGEKGVGIMKQKIRKSLDDGHNIEQAIVIACISHNNSLNENNESPFSLFFNRKITTGWDKYVKNYEYLEPLFTPIYIKYRSDMDWESAVLLHDLGDRLALVSHNNSNKLLSKDHIKFTKEITPEMIEEIENVKDNFMLNDKEYEQNESTELKENVVLNFDESTHLDNDNVHLRQPDQSQTTYHQSPRIDMEELPQLPNSDESDKLSDDQSQSVVNLGGDMSQTIEAQSSTEHVHSDPDIKIMDVDESTKRIPQNTIYTDGLKRQGVVKGIFLYRKGKFIMYKIIRLHHSKSHNDAVIKSLIEALKLIGHNKYLKESIICVSTPSSNLCKKFEELQLMDDQKLLETVRPPYNELTSLPHEWRDIKIIYQPRNSIPGNTATSKLLESSIHK